MRVVDGLSGASGKRPGGGVRRQLHVEDVGDGIVTLVPAAPARSRGLGVRIRSTLIVDALRHGRHTELTGQGLRDPGVHRLTVNRAEEHGPHDAGRAYLWIASDGDREGWDFLADDRAELLRALGP